MIVAVVAGLVDRLAQVALERDVPLEEGRRVAELAPGGVRLAQKGCCHHLDRAIAEGGIVRARPGGTIARIGEAGDDEAVIPLSRRAMRGIGLGGHTTIVHQHIAGSVVTERQLFDRWTAQLRVKTRREGATLAAGSVRTT